MYDSIVIHKTDCIKLHKYFKFSHSCKKLRSVIDDTDNDNNIFLSAVSRLQQWIYCYHTTQHISNILNCTMQVKICTIDWTIITSFKSWALA